MNEYIARGVCQKCGVNEVIAHSGYKHVCQRCNAHLFRKISEEQKENYMSTGRINGYAQKNAK
jgi:exosome complex RNA-binding protein Csl4